VRRAFVRLHPALSALAAAGLLLSLAACDDGDPQASSTPSSASTTPTPSATPTEPAPPVIPPAALNGLTVTSAEAFARFYLAATDYAAATGDVSLMRTHAYSSCATCSAIAKTYEDTYKSGGSVTGDVRVTVLAIQDVRLIRTDTAAVLIRAREGKQTWIKRAGAAPSVLPGSTYTWDITLAATDNRWTMFEMELKR
jgi:hypothetical protein